MANLTTAQYATITGATAPTDFTALLATAQHELDLRTWYYYEDGLTLPDQITTALQRFLAFAVYAINAKGGMAYLNQDPFASMTVGKVSYTSKGTGSVFSPLADQNLPLLTSYADTYRGVDD